MMESTPPQRALVALGLATAFSFLAVSLALLGAGALFTYVRAESFRGEPLGLLARWCAAFSLLLALAPFVFLRLDFSQPGVLLRGRWPASSGGG
jgi:hypothetical protein